MCFDGSWWKWGRKLQEGGMSLILTLDLGDRSHWYWLKILRIPDVRRVCNEEGAL